MNATKWNKIIFIYGLCIIVLGQGEFFPLFWLFFFKNSGTSERESTHPKKSLRSVLFFSEQSAKHAQKTYRSGECYTTRMKSTGKNLGIFEGKKFHLIKSLRLGLHQAIQVYQMSLFGDNILVNILWS